MKKRSTDRSGPHRWVQGLAGRPCQTSALSSRCTLSPLVAEMGTISAKAYCPRHRSMRGAAGLVHQSTLFSARSTGPPPAWPPVVPGGPARHRDRRAREAIDQPQDEIGLAMARSAARFRPSLNTASDWWIPGVSRKSSWASGSCGCRGSGATSSGRGRRWTASAAGGGS